MKARIKPVVLDKFAVPRYTEYALAVLEDRAIPDYRDGLNPVNRRILFTAHRLGLSHKAKHVKSARIVGDCVGRLHPHGDVAVYSSLVGMANSNSVMPLIEGAGNWGSLSNRSYAAQRYTEARLSKISDVLLFNPFYMPVVDSVPNYDSSSTEPLILPALLPILLLNGRFGIAPGAQTNIPSCKYSSVLKLLRLVYEGHELTAKLAAKTLQFVSLYGGVERDSSPDRRALFKTSKGRAVLWSNPVLANNTITITRFAVSTAMDKLLEKLSRIEGVAEVRDDSSHKDRYGTVTVQLKRGTNGKDVLARVDAALSDAENYVLNFTERYIDETGQGKAKVCAMSLTEMLKRWIAWRMDLEKRACSYWIKETDKEIRRLELLMMAVDNRKLIIESLDKNLDEKALEEWLAKRLKISVAEAHFIYQLRVMQLRKLERKTLEAKMVETVKNKTQLSKRRDKPLPAMAKQLVDFRQFALP